MGVATEGDEVSFGDAVEAIGLGDGLGFLQPGLCVDLRGLDAERRILWVRDTLTIFTHNGLTRLLGVAVNITDRKELEQQLNDPEFQAKQFAEIPALVAKLDAAKAGVTRLYHRWEELGALV